MTVLEVRRALERHRLGGIFVGGSAGPGTPKWKWRTVHDWAELGLELGVRVHVGRVNGERRAALCRDLGVTSIDGSAVSRFAVNGTKMGRSCDGTEPVHPPPGPGRVGLPAALEREIAELEPVARHTIAKRRFQLALDAIDP
jgi:EAL domain-containing protein (putative c-di-GMP-specific phosphodiesterase class I)